MSERTEADAIGANARSVDRLRQLVDRLDDRAMGRDLGEGWTVGVALAHLAFWDRLSARRLRSWLDTGELNDLQGATDLVNEASLFQWRALPASAVRAEALGAATVVNQLVASAGPGRVAALVAAGKPRWAHRHLHRMEHVEQIEKALGAGSHQGVS